MNRLIRIVLVTAICALFLMPVSAERALLPERAVHYTSDILPIFSPNPHLVSNSTSAPVFRSQSGGGINSNLADRIVRTTDNKLHVVWEDANEVYYSNSTDNGATWSPALAISNTPALTSQYPSISVSGNRIFVTWSDTVNANANQYIYMRRSNNSGQDWDPALTQAPIIVYSALGWPNGIARVQPHIHVQNDDVYVIYLGVTGGGNQQNTYMKVSTDNGTTWSAERPIDTAAPNPFFVTSAVDGNYIYIAERKSLGGGNEDIFVAVSDAGNASTALNFTTTDVSNTTGTYSSSPALLVANGIVYLAWEERNGGGGIYNISMRYSTDHGGNWTPNLTRPPMVVYISSGDSRDPSLGESGGQVYCIWEQQFGGVTRDLWAAASMGGLYWSDPIAVANNTLEDDTDVSLRASAYIDGTNKQYLDWAYMNGTGAGLDPYHVMYSNLEGRWPVLSWTGEVGYTSDGVDPNTGYSGQTYTFRVNYSDQDNDAPKMGSPALNVDLNIDGDYGEPGESIVMTAENSADTNYKDGKIYVAEVKPFTKLGTSTYSIKAFDVNDLPSTGAANGQHNGPTITGFNNEPVLLWTEEAGYATDGLEPETGISGTQFVFRIRYMDADNDAPASGNPKLLVDMDGDGLFNGTSDLSPNMTAVTSLDTSYDNGKLYFLNMSFSPGDYKYMFTAEDSVGLKCKTQNRSAPHVSITGVAPVLALTGGAGYTADGVEPNTGFDNTEFVFKVKYSDADNDTPVTGSVMVWVDMNHDGAMNNTTEWFAMNASDPTDVNYVDGKVYEYRTMLATGFYNHSFKAMDVNLNQATTANYTGPVVTGHNNPPVLDWIGSGAYQSSGVDPAVGYVNETVFKYAVKYTDADGDLPAAGYPEVWIDRDLDNVKDASEVIAMSEENATDTTVADGKDYVLLTNITAPGIYHYAFLAKDANNIPATGNAPLVSKEGPIVTVPPIPNEDPVLDWVGQGSFIDRGVNPLVGTPSTTFDYMVKYSDAEGEAPATDTPLLRIFKVQSDGTTTPETTVVLKELDVLDTDVMDGKIYHGATTFPDAGEYTYTIEASTVAGAAAIGPAIDEMDGPSVVVNSPPTLIWAGTAGFSNDGIDPDTGVVSETKFTYKMKYTDPEGDAPAIGFPQVWIDANMDGLFGTDEGYAMIADTSASNDGDYKNGEVFMLTGINFTKVGSAKYRFACSDAFNNPAIGDPITVKNGPIVELPVVEQPPSLVTVDAKGNPSTDGLDPNRAEPGANSFTFSVKYSDPNGDAPVTDNPSLVVYSKADRSDAKTYKMTTAPGTPDYKKGAVYVATITNLAEGSYKYEFSVNNVKGENVRLGPFDGPFVIKTETGTTDGGEEEGDENAIQPWWYGMVILALVIGLVLGVIVGRSRKKEAQPPQASSGEERDERPHRRTPRQADLGPRGSGRMMDEAEEDGDVATEDLPAEEGEEDVEEGEGSDEKPPEPEVKKEEEPPKEKEEEKKEEKPDEGTGGAEEEKGSELKGHEEESEQKPGDIKVEKDIDSILSKLGE